MGHARTLGCRCIGLRRRGFRRRRRINWRRHSRSRPRGCSWLDGEASFVDRDKYLAVPSVRIEDPDIVARFTKATTNHHPEIPIAVTGIDYAALDRHVPFADDRR